MTQKPSKKSAEARKPPKPPKQPGIGFLPGAGGERFNYNFPTKEGIIGSYLHPGARIGALVELICGSNSLARTEDFISLAKELCLQVAAASPTDCNVLLEQPYVREPSGKIKVKDLLADASRKMGETVTVRHFVRFEVGKDFILGRNKDF